MLKDIPSAVIAILVQTYRDAWYAVYGQRRMPSGVRYFRQGQKGRLISTFRNLYKLLEENGFDHAEYIRWALASDKTAHHSPNILVSQWRVEAFQKYLKKNKVGQNADGRQNNSRLQIIEDDCMLAWSRWFEKQAQYGQDFAAFIAGEYRDLPVTFLVLHPYQFGSQQTGLWVSTNPVAGDVYKWRMSLEVNKELAADMEKLNAATFKQCRSLAESGIS